MSEEEKKAIDILEDCLGNSCLYIEGEYGFNSLDDKTKGAIKIILNLIEKQQTRIEELEEIEKEHKEENGKLREKIKLLEE